MSDAKPLADWPRDAEALDRNVGEGIAREPLHQNLELAQYQRQRLRWSHLVDVADVPVFNASEPISFKPGRKPLPQKGKMLCFFESDDVISRLKVGNL